jgi:ABC-2 type transport system ATP-binding protein
VTTPHAVTDIVLSAQGLSKTYGQHTALSDFSCEVKAGEVVGVLGPNGAGKTTAIRILTTILPATRGHFTLMGIPDSCPREIRALIGVVPESNGFPRSMTGEEYLIYIGRLYGMTKTQVSREAERLLHVVGLTKAGKARTYTYSLGMRRRLGIARALIHSPRLLFLDEPTLGIDPVGQREILQIVKCAVEGDQVAVILSSHLLEVVDQVCSRVLILNRGHVIAQDTVSEVKQHFSVGLQSCRVRVPSNRISEARTALSALKDVETTLNTDHGSEIVVTIQNETMPLNDVLQCLIQAGIPVESFDKDQMSLSDAFLSMIEEVTVA